MKVAVYNLETDHKPNGRIAWIFCPGCQHHHKFKLDTPQENGAMWTYNENPESPTFNPSLLVWASEPAARCHSFVRDGNIQFLSDCFHDLKNQTVPLPEVEI